MAKIKYSDKSGGQPGLTLVFDEIKKLMILYAKGSLVLKGGTDGQVALITNKPVVIEGRKSLFSHQKYEEALRIGYDAYKKMGWI